MAEKDDYLVDILIDLGFASSEQVEGLRAEAQSAGVGVVDLMLANKLVRPEDVTQAKAAHFGAEVVSLAGMRLGQSVRAQLRPQAFRLCFFLGLLALGAYLALRGLG